MTYKLPVITDKPRRGWSQQQLTLLQDYFCLFSAHEIALHISKHPETVNNKAKQLNIQRTKEEEARIRSRAAYKGKPELTPKEWKPRQKREILTPEERIIRTKAKKLKHYYEKVKPRRQLEIAESLEMRLQKRAEREAKAKAKALKKEQKQQKAAAKLARQEAKQASDLKLKQGVQQLQLTTRKQKATTPIKTIVDKKPDTGKLPDITSYKDRVRKMSYSERIEHLNSQVRGLVAVQIDHKTTVFKKPERV